MATSVKAFFDQKVPVGAQEQPREGEGRRGDLPVQDRRRRRWHAGRSISCRRPPTCLPGSQGTPQCTIEATDDDFRSMIDGGMQAAMQLFFSCKAQGTGRRHSRDQAARSCSQMAELNRLQRSAARRSRSDGAPSPQGRSRRSTRAARAGIEQQRALEHRFELSRKFPASRAPASALDRVRRQLDRAPARRASTARASSSDDMSSRSRPAPRRMRLPIQTAAGPDLQPLAQRRQREDDARERSRGRAGSAPPRTSPARSRSDIAMAWTPQLGVPRVRLVGRRGGRRGPPSAAAAAPSAGAGPGRPPPRPAACRRRPPRARPRPCPRRAAPPARRRRRTRRRPGAPAACPAPIRWCSARARPSLPVPGSPSSTKFVRYGALLQALDDIEDRRHRRVRRRHADERADRARGGRVHGAQSRVAGTRRLRSRPPCPAPSGARAARASPAPMPSRRSMVAWSAAGNR